MFGKPLGKTNCKWCGEEIEKKTYSQVFCSNNNRECLRSWIKSEYAKNKHIPMLKPIPIYKWHCDKCDQIKILEQDPIKLKAIECDYCKNNV